MAPPLLILRDIHLTFGSTPLLTGADLSVSEGDRLCLVGRNGSGKSTLLKIAAGLIEADKGEYFLQPGRTLRYLPQEPDLLAYATILDYVNDGLAPGDDPYRAPYLLEVLGLTGKEDPRSLSGGEARRAALARALAPEPDILLLDEPTNHLDLPAIEWLESELKGLKSAIVLISHDRRFLENLSRATVWVDRGTTRRMDRGFEHFEAWRDEVFEQEERDQQKLAQQIKREEHWMRYGVTARRKRNMRRVRELADLRDKARNHRGPQGSAKLTVTEGETSGKLVVEAKSASKTYGERAIVANFSTRIQRGDRVGFIGANGAGKTTLLKMLTGELEPDSGTVRLGTNLQMVTLDQKRERLNPDDTLSNVLTGGRGDTVVLGTETKHVIAYMKDFLFSPEQARTPVGVLSGGERARAMLARALASPSNIMVLDEPTNDLDLETLDLLQELLSDYDGTVLLVSHDRDFLDRVATSVIVSEGDGKWQEYAGGYSDMVAQRGAGVTARKAEKAQAKSAKAAAPASSAAATTAKPAAKTKLSFSQLHLLKTLPDTIETLTKKLEKLQGEMADPQLYSRNPDRFAKLSAEITKLTGEKDAAEEQWLELEMLKEEAEG
ncbi:ABC-F family ATP-binding cassette domain-containing protein [Pannonibacter sp. SL95]|uniref:ABC-F family ATP-binding cassette domain-containing protein n=1 Tax=Pannonibacter sp. SL95 TaxID=2995153 RepID=UPI002272E184|nr:ABC-F family ATP-binding cassette domain-containing protein [Pannonibacter sp. SL95]MCY1708455.1 ABC-F family ATP-binding cassette domain-containing protein [Pannonibacter sp. SL95]